MLKKITKILSFLLCFVLIFQQTGFAQAAAVELNLSGYFARMASNITVDKFRPLHLRYLSYDALSNNFNLLLDKGDQKGTFPKGTPSETQLKEESNKLLKYFFIGVSLPNDKFWVNLRPDSPDNIIDDQLANTDIGKIFLEADLQLKKDTANYTSPQTPEGKEYWDKLYKKAAELYGTENMTIPTLTRPWIVPGEIIIRETKGQSPSGTVPELPSAYIYKATLKVMLEADYLSQTVGDTFHQVSNEAVNRKVSPGAYEFKDSRSKALNEYSSQLIRELIIPKLTKEVNSSKRYAPLRQVYYSLILAQWFKQKFKQGLSPQGTVPNRIDSKDLTNLISKEDWDKTTYFNAYKRSFAEGEYNIKEPVYTPTGQVIRSYFSGGVKMLMEPVVLTGPSSPIGGKSYLMPVSFDKNGIVTQSLAGSPVLSEQKIQDLEKELAFYIMVNHDLGNFAQGFISTMERNMLKKEISENSVDLEKLRGLIHKSLELTTDGDEARENPEELSDVLKNLRTVNRQLEIELTALQPLLTGDLAERSDLLMAIVNPELPYSVVDLREALEWVFGWYKHAYGFKIDFLNELKTNNNLFLGDKYQLKRIIGNLLSNSESAFINNHVDWNKRLVEISLALKENGYIITYKDNAGGIPAELLGKIFEPRFTTKNKEDNPLSGFGMVITKEFIEKMGGTISVQSELGKGTTFTITLPAATSSPAAAGSTKLSSSPLSPEERVKELLHSKGIEAIFARNKSVSPSLNIEQWRDNLKNFLTLDFKLMTGIFDDIDRRSDEDKIAMLKQMIQEMRGGDHPFRELDGLELEHLFFLKEPGDVNAVFSVHGYFLGKRIMFLTDHADFNQTRKFYEEDKGMREDTLRNAKTAYLFLWAAKILYENKTAATSGPATDSVKPAASPLLTQEDRIAIFNESIRNPSISKQIELRIIAKNPEIPQEEIALVKDDQFNLSALRKFLLGQIRKYLPYDFNAIDVLITGSVFDLSNDRGQLPIKALTSLIGDIDVVIVIKKQNGGAGEMQQASIWSEISYPFIKSRLENALKTELRGKISKGVECGVIVAKSRIDAIKQLADSLLEAYNFYFLEEIGKPGLLGYFEFFDKKGNDYWIRRVKRYLQLENLLGDTAIYSKYRNEIVHAQDPVAVSIKILKNAVPSVFAQFSTASPLAELKPDQSRLIDNRMMDSLLARRPRAKERDRKTLGQFLAMDHPEVKKILAKIDSLSDKEILDRADTFLRGDILARSYKDHTKASGLDRHLTLRELFLRPATGGPDLSQVFLTAFPFPKEIIVLLDDDQDLMRKIIEEKYLLMKALEVLSRESDLVLINKSDIDELYAYLLKEFPCPETALHLLSLIDIEPHDSPQREESLRNLLSLIDKLKNKDQEWRDVFTSEECKEKLNRLRKTSIISSPSAADTSASPMTPQKQVRILLEENEGLNDIFKIFFKDFKDKENDIRGIKNTLRNFLEIPFEAKDEIFAKIIAESDTDKMDNARAAWEDTRWGPSSSWGLTLEQGVCLQELPSLPEGGKYDFAAHILTTFIWQFAGTKEDVKEIFETLGNDKEQVDGWLKSWEMTCRYLWAAKILYGKGPAVTSPSTNQIGSQGFGISSPASAGSAKPSASPLSPKERVKELLYSKGIETIFARNKSVSPSLNIEQWRDNLKNFLTLDFKLMTGIFDDIDRRSDEDKIAMLKQMIQEMREGEHPFIELGHLFFLKEGVDVNAVCSVHGYLLRKSIMFLTGHQYFEENREFYEQDGGVRENILRNAKTAYLFLWAAKILYGDNGIVTSSLASVDSAKPSSSPLAVLDSIFAKDIELRHVGEGGKPILLKYEGQKRNNSWDYEIYWLGNNVGSVGLFIAPSWHSDKQLLHLQHIRIWPESWQRHGLSTSIVDWLYFTAKNNNLDFTITGDDVYLERALERAKAKYGELDGSGSSSMGGIDMRHLAKNTVIERDGSLNLVKGQSPSGTDPKELEEIQRLIQAGIIPATRRLEECRGACSAEALLSCVADILRIEEERVTQTEAGLKNLLASL